MKREPLRRARARLNALGLLPSTMSIPPLVGPLHDNNADTSTRLSATPATPQDVYTRSSFSASRDLLSHGKPANIQASPRHASTTLDREGKPISTINDVPIDLVSSLFRSAVHNGVPRADPRLLRQLQSLYLSPPVPSPPLSRPSSPAHPIAAASAALTSSTSAHSRMRSNDSAASDHSYQSTIAWPRSVTFSSRSTYPPVKRLSQKERKRILVTGGAGFVGSHLVCVMR